MSEERGRGAPPGSKREGTYGYGVKTRIARVPVDFRPTDLTQIEEVKDLVRRWKSRAKDTRDWTQAKKLIEQLCVTMQIDVSQL